MTNMFTNTQVNYRYLNWKLLNRSNA